MIKKTQTRLLKKLFTISIFVLLVQAEGFCSQKKEERRFPFPTIGFKIGTDLGAATPFPFKYIPAQMSPTIHPKLTLGGRIAIPLPNGFTPVIEANFKTLSLSADAMVQDQQFSTDGLITYFSGQATMDMSFSMLEFPVYLRYEFKKKKDAVALGGYYAIVKDAKFETIAKKGMMGDFPGDKNAMILKEDQMMPFTEDLDNWDAGMVLGYRRKIIRWIYADAMMYVGFKSIFIPSFDKLAYKMYPIRGSFSISCDLNIFSK